MAFYKNDDNNDELTKQSAYGGVASASPSGIINSSGGPSASAPQTGLSAPTTTPDKTSFVGIKQYLDANKSQAANLGDQAAGVINTSADQARQGVNDLNSAASAAIKPTQSLGTDILSKLNSTPESLSDAEKNQIKSTEKATYTGPQSATDLGDAYTNAAKAQKAATENINNSGTEQGRMNLISQINNKPRTQGMNVFDNALLQAGGGREKLATAANQNQDVKTGLDTASQAINAKIGRADDPNTPNINEATGAIGQTNQAQANAYGSVQDALNNWKNGFGQKLASAPNSITQQADAIQSDFDNNPDAFDPATLKALGLNTGTNLYNLDLNDYLTRFSPTDINASNVASNDDFARYAALADLAGDQSNYLNPADAGKQQAVSPFTFDQNKFNTDSQSAQKNISGLYQDTSKQIDSITNQLKSPGQYASALSGMNDDQILNYKNTAPAGTPQYKAIEAVKAQTEFKKNPTAETLKAALSAGDNFSLQGMYDYQKANGFGPNVTNPYSSQQLQQIFGTNGLLDRAGALNTGRTISQNVPTGARVGIARPSNTDSSVTETELPPEDKKLTGKRIKV